MFLYYVPAGIGLLFTALAIKAFVRSGQRRWQWIGALEKIPRRLLPTPATAHRCTFYSRTSAGIMLAKRRRTRR